MTEFKQMWTDLKIVIESDQVFMAMDTDANDCLSEQEWSIAVEKIRATCDKMNANN